ncbi:MAG TPA: rhomboid family intramembrane serine protease [Solirubrobacteraceae bacterium]|jgi:membrane associated rhomboid family serine protease|nr:rhomboid family intramembrane serine protease [Solirubrobacteraceae bacterium]
MSETCYRHPGRETGVSCSSCGRPICPDCMTATPVGMRCPECSRQRTRVHTMRTMRNDPRVTIGLIAINVIAFLASNQFTLASSQNGDSFFQHGELYGPAIHLQHQYYRLLTGAFLHENILHIGMNMYVLFILGVVLEPVVGSRRFAAIYFAALFAGALGALLATPHSPTVGASGAIFGIAGAFAMELWARGVNPVTSQIGFFIIANLVISVSIPGISIGGHIGGLIGGALCGLGFQQADRRRMPALGYAGCVLIAVISIAAAIAVAKSGPLYVNL